MLSDSVFLFVGAFVVIVTFLVLASAPVLKNAQTQQNQNTSTSPESMPTECPTSLTAMQTSDPSRPRQRYFCTMNPTVEAGYVARTRGDFSMSNTQSPESIMFPQLGAELARSRRDPSNAGRTLWTINFRGDDRVLAENPSIFTWTPELYKN